MGRGRGIRNDAHPLHAGRHERKEKKIDELNAEEKQDQRGPSLRAV
jgi:hypothetical protein